MVAFRVFNLGEVHLTIVESRICSVQTKRKTHVPAKYSKIIRFTNVHFCLPLCYSHGISLTFSSLGSTRSFVGWVTLAEFFDTAQLFDRSTAVLHKKTASSPHRLRWLAHPRLLHQPKTVRAITVDADTYEHKRSSNDRVRTKFSLLGTSSYWGGLCATGFILLPV